MNRQLLGLAAVALLALGLGCVNDPTSSLRGSGVAEIQLTLSQAVVNVGDSVSVNAIAKDDQGDILTDLPAVTAVTPAVATVTGEATRPPLPGLYFYVKGVSSGVGLVVVSAGSVADTITVEVP
jgi:hypothetical protein